MWEPITGGGAGRKGTVPAGKRSPRLRPTLLTPEGGRGGARNTNRVHGRLMGGRRECVSQRACGKTRSSSNGRARTCGRCSGGGISRFLFFPLHSLRLVSTPPLRGTSSYIPSTPNPSDNDGRSVASAYANSAPPLFVSGCSGPQV
eukprot:4526269-Pyramimonas_sp.AAC.2